jgi:hypothetical protein
MFLSVREPHCSLIRVSRRPYLWNQRRVNQRDIFVAPDPNTTREIINRHYRDGARRR